MTYAITYNIDIRTLILPEDLAKRLGFREIGRRRQARLIAGTYYDEVMMDLLADEFRGHRIRDLVATIGPEIGQAGEASETTSA